MGLVRYHSTRIIRQLPAGGAWPVGALNLLHPSRRSHTRIRIISARHERLRLDLLRASLVTKRNVIFGVSALFMKE